MRVLPKFLFAVPAVAALLCVGYAVGHFFADPIVEVIPAAGPSATVTVRDGSDAAALSKALSEVAALKAENAALRKRLQETAGTLTPQPQAEREQPRRHSWRERMEEMRARDPERYKEEMARREQFRQAMAQARTERADFLGSIDIALLSDEGRETHARFVEAFAKSAEVEEKMRMAFESGEQPSEALVTEAREVMRTLHETRSSERVALLDAIATSMGLSGTDVEDFRKLVDEVYDATGHGGPRPVMPPMRMAPAASAGAH